MQQFTGYEYIKIALANKYGHDKLTWDERIQWTDDNVHEANMQQLIATADDPYLFIKAYNAKLAAERGEPTGYLMDLDATASGPQILAALTGCEESAKNVNIVNTGRREDLYTNVFDTQCKYVSGVNISRAMIKTPVIATFYGSTNAAIETFGEDTVESKAFHKAIHERLPGAMEALESMISCWNPNALEHKWTLPNGHKIVSRSKAQVSKKIELDGLGHAKFTYNATINEPVPYSVALAACITQSIDGYIATEMITRANKQGFDLLTVFDSFWASPNHMNEVRQNYVDIFVELANSNLLENILNEITGCKGRYIKKSNTLGELIKHAEYALS